MEYEPSNTEKVLPPEEAAAKAAILAECENLSAAGITFVAVHFDGCGDSGVTEEVQCLDSESYPTKSKSQLSITRRCFKNILRH
jgi:hypothetical protein